MIPRFHKLSIAAWILSLATDPARAATTVGDFSEESPAHRRTWFWRQIARTLGAHVVHNFTVAPLRLLLSAVTATLLGLGAYVVLQFSMASLSLIWSGIYYSFVPEPPGNWLPEPPLLPLLAIAGAYILTAHVAVGVCIARTSRLPLASWISWSLLCTLLWIAFSIAAHRVASYPAMSLLLVLVGVIWERRRALRTA